MCLAIPMQLVDRNELDGTAEVDGVRRRIGTMLCPEAEVGDWVLVHAGYAIGTIDAEEARLSLELMRAALADEVGDLNPADFRREGSA